MEKNGHQMHVPLQTRLRQVSTPRLCNTANAWVLFYAASTVHVLIKIMLRSIFLQKEAAAIYSGLNIPYIPAPIVKVPNLTGDQKAAINVVVRGMIRTVPAPRWQRQAMRALSGLCVLYPTLCAKLLKKLKILQVGATLSLSVIAHRSTEPCGRQEGQ